MVGTIVPIGHGERARGRKPVALAVHVLGTTVGGAFIGSILGLVGGTLGLGHMSMAARLGLIIAASALYSSHEIGLLRAPIPRLRRQVPVQWRLTMRPRRRALLYGLLLGGGLLTYVPVSTYYVVAAWSVLSGSALLGAAAMGAFGFARGVPILWIGLLRGGLIEKFHLSESLAEWKSLAQMVNGLVLGFSAAVLLAAALTSP